MRPLMMRAEGCGQDDGNGTRATGRSGSEGAFSGRDRLERKGGKAMKSIAKLVANLWRSFLRRRLWAELPAGAFEHEELCVLARIH